jgi:hypothetical protein
VGDDLLLLYHGVDMARLNLFDTLQLLGWIIPSQGRSTYLEDGEPEWSYRTFYFESIEGTVFTNPHLLEMAVRMTWMAPGPVLSDLTEIGLPTECVSESYSSMLLAEAGISRVHTLTQEQSSSIMARLVALIVLLFSVTFFAIWGP